MQSSRSDHQLAPEVEETRLPGVGIRHDFVTKSGQRIGMISHFSGRRDLLIYNDADPDSCKDTVELEDHDSRVLSELLGASHVTEHLTQVQQAIKGLAIDWLPIDLDSPFIGKTISDTRMRSETGTTIVAVIRSGEALPAPTSNLELHAGDVAVVVGTPEGIREAIALLHGTRTPSEPGNSST